MMMMMIIFKDLSTSGNNRERALSELPVSRSTPHTITGAAGSNVRGSDWTWSGTGATKIFNIVNEHHKRYAKKKVSGT